MAPTHCAVRTDAVLLERVLGNLVSNAIRYTQRGKVLVGCRRRPGGVELQVWDTGIGIAPAHLPHDQKFFSNQDFMRPNTCFTSRVSRTFRPRFLCV